MDTVEAVLERCRVCGRSDFKGNNKKHARQVHESRHVKRGEAIYTSGPVPGGDRSIQAVGSLTPNPLTPTDAPVLPSTPRTRKLNSVDYDGRPCEICGTTTAYGKPFQNMGAWLAHRLWHARNGEAKWAKGRPGRGRYKALLPTRRGIAKFGNHPATNLVEPNRSAPSTDLVVEPEQIKIETIEQPREQIPLDAERYEELVNSEEATRLLQGAAALTMFSRLLTINGIERTLAMLNGMANLKLPRR